MPDRRSVQMAGQDHARPAFGTGRLAIPWQNVAVSRAPNGSGRSASWLIGSLRNTLERHLCSFGIAASKIGERDDANEPFVTIEHRQPPHLMLGHGLCGVAHVVILETVINTLRHDLTHRGVAGGPVLGDGAHDDVTVSHHSDEAIVFP